MYNNKLHAISSQSGASSSGTGHIKPLLHCAKTAVQDIPNGSRILVGGFGLCGVPDMLLDGLVKAQQTGLTLITALGGTSSSSLGQLFANQQVKRVITSHVGDNTVCVDQYLAGEVEVEFTPLGTLAERIRCGSNGNAGFYSRTGQGTAIENGGSRICNLPTELNSEPREIRLFNGVPHLFEEAIQADYALVKAWKADRMGNLIFKATARNLNPVIARCARFTIAEIEEIVEVGELDSNYIHTPAVYVNRLVLRDTDRPKPIERLTYRTSMSHYDQVPTSEQIRARIARRAALELRDGMTVNLGMGMPMLVSSFIPIDCHVMIQSENGIVGVGPYPNEPGDEDADLINASKQTITAVPGAVYLDSCETFDMIRGGHLALTMLGSMQVSSSGDMANWIIPGEKVKGMGGAMDLVCAPNMRVIVTMQHCTPSGAPKILNQCTLPLTGRSCVDMIITEMAVFVVDKTQRMLNLIEIADGYSVEDIRDKTEAQFTVVHDVRPMQQAPWHKK